MIKEKRWNFKKYEKEIYEYWKKYKIYEFKLDDREIFSIDTPPPYTSGDWHIGAVASYIIHDVVARSARMQGYNVLFPFGLDRNGLPVEVYVEKKYKISIARGDVSREDFIELCRKELDKLGEQYKEIVKRCGIFYNYFDADHPYKTDSDEYRALTQLTFEILWKRGLIYKDKRVNNWCWRCGTTIADAEIEYKEVEQDLYYIKFDLEDGNHIIIATTRPELIPACRVIIYHPDDERYTNLEGKYAINPITQEKILIKSHPRVEKEFGTGIEMVCSYGSFADIEILEEFGIKSKIIINPAGKLNENAGKYQGLTIKEAREKIVEDLRKEGRIVKQEKIKSNVPICWRCKTPIEFIEMEEYYLKQKEFKEELLALAEKMKFYPEKYKEHLITWIKNINRDWPISRRRYYATEIPIWYCKRCGYIYVPEPNFKEPKYYKPWKEKPPIDKCPNCGSTEWVGEKRVFDTWFDSSISELYVARYVYDMNIFNKAFPVTVRPQGYEIIRTWLYYTLLRSYLLFGKEPFKYVIINGMGVDEKGRKMSKSLGNIVFPIPIIEKYGADALRMWAVGEVKLGENYPFKEHKVAGNAKFINKLFNIGRFVSQFNKLDNYDTKKLYPTDKAIIAKFNKILRAVIEAYKNFDFFTVVRILKRFTREDFASNYLELVKKRLKGGLGNEKNSALFTIHYVFKGILLLWAPILPFITEYLWQKIYAKNREDSIHKQLFPKAIEIDKEEEYADKFNKIIEFNAKIWKLKEEKGLKLKDVISIDIPKDLEEFKEDLINLHNIVCKK